MSDHSRLRMANTAVPLKGLWAVVACLSPLILIGSIVLIVSVVRHSPTRGALVVGIAGIVLLIIGLTAIPLLWWRLTRGRSPRGTNGVCEYCGEIVRFDPHGGCPACRMLPASRVRELEGERTTQQPSISGLCMHCRTPNPLGRSVCASCGERPDVP